MKLVVALNPLAGAGAGSRAAPGIVGGLQEQGHELEVVGLQGPDRLRTELGEAAGVAVLPASALSVEHRWEPDPG